MAKHPLRLLASKNKERGDLFERLVSDLFYTLGYDNLRFGVHKTGREIDIQGIHRHEPKMVIAECKAHATPIGGADLNKILGAITRERDKGQDVAGYFVSLGGFTESALEQELSTTHKTRIIPFDAEAVISELIKSNILIEPEKAIERAGRCAEYSQLAAETQFSYHELLGHSLGYIWALYYEQGKCVTHFALIHADGNPLSDAAAKKVIAADKQVKGKLHKLSYVSPPTPAPDRNTIRKQTIDRYNDWLANACGYIQLDGLPAEGTIASQQMRLENLFVPLKLVTRQAPYEDDEALTEEKPELTVEKVGEFLNKHNRLSILAKPGGGKSTLLKRLAVAYSDPKRLLQAQDDLPERDWFPLMLRCRDLRDKSSESIRELLCGLGRLAEMNDEHAASFRSLVDEALNSGRALLLVDGLDEFSDESARTRFANNLRIFLGMYPHTSLVVTSREAGFRQVAGVIAGVCKQTSMATFDEDDVHALCARWHSEVLPDTRENREEAQKLASTIWDNERIRALAENPLMLTTLLVVKRNVGELPTKRVKLYAEAIKVLIRTWNVEGFAPLDEDETLARLSYIAVAMMRSGKQRIGEKQLLKLLNNAQTDLEEELFQPEVKPRDFIQRVEYRSSLLMQTGYEEVDGELQAVYEFRHLTFQEYLAARGLVEEQYPGRDESSKLLSLLEPYLQDEQWREVIPLAAVLAKKKSDELINRLIKNCADIEPDIFEGEPSVSLLLKCVLDEIQVKESTIRTALKTLARFVNETSVEQTFTPLWQSKFSEMFEEESMKAFFNEEKDWHFYWGPLQQFSLQWYFDTRDAKLNQDICEKIKSDLESGDISFQCLAMQAITWSAFRYDYNNSKNSDEVSDYFKEFKNRIDELLLIKNEQVALCASLALVWLEISGLSETKPKTEILIELFYYWQNAKNPRLREIAGWAFSVQPLLNKTSVNSKLFELDMTFREYDKLEVKELKRFLPQAWYSNALKEDEITALAEKYLSDIRLPVIANGNLGVFNILEALGEPGKEILDKWLSNINKSEQKQLSRPIKRILGIEN